MSSEAFFRLLAPRLIHTYRHMPRGTRWRHLDVPHLRQVAALHTFVCTIPLKNKGVGTSVITTRSCLRVTVGSSKSPSEEDSPGLQCVGTSLPSGMD